MLNLSPDAILFGLSLLEKGAISPRALAAHLRAVAAGGSPDQLVALEERVMESSPAEERTRLSAQPYYALVHCGGCRGRFRVLHSQAARAAVCPLCGEALAAGRSLLLLGEPRLTSAAAEDAAPYATAFPRQFAHFELLRLIGSGGGGKVYEARNLRAGRRVAVKVLAFSALESSGESLRRAGREARAAQVRDQNVVAVYDMGLAEGVPFVEMELVRGRSLRQLVEKDGPLAPPDACRLCAGALSGLAAVHERKIVHGDVKPGNILVDAEGRARLTDFGVARFLEEITSATTRRLMGTPHFMVPEQWRGEALTPQTDLYAVGLVLYYALTGKLPYEGRSHAALMYAHLHEPLIAPGTGGSLVPQELGPIICRAVQKRPADRFASARQFQDALRPHVCGGAALSD